MDQGEILALGLALGFGLGWATAWIQETAYRRRQVQGLELDLESEKARSIRLEKALEKETATVDRIGALLDLELQKVGELRSQLRNLVELELAQEKAGRPQSSQN